jgi:hypothetical protein
MNETEQKCLALFAQQEAEFKTWMLSFWECAFYLRWIREQLGTKKFLQWLARNFREDQMEIVNHMLYQIEHTDTGRQILEASSDPDHFSFSA